MNKELLPCAHCGGKAKLLKSDKLKPFLWSIYCTKCQSGMGPNDSYKEAHDKWNHRPNQPTGIEIDTAALAKLVANYYNKNSLLYDGCKGLAEHITQNLKSVLKEKV